MEARVEAPERWGLDAGTVGLLGERVRAVWMRYRGCFRTRTRDTSEQAWIYLRGLLTVDQERTFANIARRVQGPLADGQRVRHFMAASPWSARTVLEQVCAEVAQQGEIRAGNVLILDESADGKAGEQTAGAGRQYNGRLGKVELSQVGTFLALANEARRFWTWIDGELFLPERWFTPRRAELRQQLGVPAERQFATKIELGWQMIQRVRAAGVPFEAVLCDEWYGRGRWLRAQLDAAGLLYAADVPADTPVYLTPPAFGVPAKVPREQGAKGRANTHPCVLDQSQPLPAAQVATLPDTDFTVVAVREAERGLLADTFAPRRVWTVREDQLAAEWLIIRRHQGRPGVGTPVKQKISYALSNAPAQTPLARLAELKCLRYGIECANREAKSDLGGDDFRAQKYRACGPGSTISPSLSSPPGLWPRPSWSGHSTPRPIPRSLTPSAWRAGPRSRSPMSASCSKPACPCPCPCRSSRPTRRTAWWSNISSAARGPPLVAAASVSTPSRIRREM